VTALRRIANVRSTRLTDGDVFTLAPRRISRIEVFCCFEPPHETESNVRQIHNERP